MGTGKSLQPGEQTFVEAGEQTNSEQAGEQTNSEQASESDESDEFYDPDWHLEVYPEGAHAEDQERLPEPKRRAARTPRDRPSTINM